MSTRAASAATSRRAKQELVRLLFGHEATSAKSSIAYCRSQKLDYAQYSYNDLRSAFLQKVQELHPDKHRNDPHHYSTVSHSNFVKLQEAWDAYEAVAKMAKKVENEEHKLKDFTMFGVGCSFSDNEVEREWRSEITDQACRGWFSSGTLAESSEDSRAADVPSFGKETSLLHDDMFVVEHDSEENGEASKKQEQPQQTKPPRRSLVDFGPRSSASYR
mgnify:CR=1 FL=1